METDKCPHCGSKNLGPKYTETLDKHGVDDPMYQETVDVTLRDCQDCGELGAVERA